MKKLTVKIPAKINLILDVLGTDGNYHQLQSFVASINVYDTVTVKARTDEKITLKMQGVKVDCPISKNNAYKAVKLFKKTFKCTGVDVVVNKSIPVGAGLGGSSADIAGVLKAMKGVYGITESVLPLANDLGSDAGYMLTGGYALMQGRGENIIYEKIGVPLYFLLITENNSCSAKECYKEFDKQNKTYTPTAKDGINALKNGDYDGFYSAIKNDLTAAATTFVPQITSNIEMLKKAGAKGVAMTGSGSVCFAVFDSKKERDRVYKKLKPIYNEQLLKAQTV